MKLAQAIEGGLTGAAMLTLLQETLHKIDHKAPRPLLHQSGIIKKIKKHSGKNDLQSNKLYVKLAGELLANAAYFGLAGLGKKKNAILRGGLLGAAAGLGSAFIRDDHDELGTEELHLNGDNKLNGEKKIVTPPKELSKKMMTVAIYTAGGLLAGLAVKKINKKGGKKLARMLRAKR